jgi:hypothetical protein
LEKKRILNQVPLPPGMIRLAAVLAEIAQNEETSAAATESVCAVREKIEQEKEITSEWKRK